MPSGHIANRETPAIKPDAVAMGLQAMGEVAIARAAGRPTTPGLTARW